MAHTYRDDARIARRNHHRDECPNRWSLRQPKDRTEKPCLTCSKEPVPRYYTGTNGKAAWNRDQRRDERGRAKTAIGQCRDFDDLTITYRRPYWD